MNFAFIACEYNPFHNGHLYHITKTRESGADAIICIMSGNFVQRGDVAIAEKHSRAKIALMNGADLVLELPLKYAVAPAQLFADGFIKTAAATGLDGFISFGAKDDLCDLIKLVDCMFSDNAENFAALQVKNGFNYAKAKSMFVEKELGEYFSNILNDANNMLALEYLRSARAHFPTVGIKSITRKNVMHNSILPDGNFASASYIRKLLYDSYDNSLNDFLHSIKRFIPDNEYNYLLNEYSSGRFPSDRNRFEIATVSRLFTLTLEEIAVINNVNEGLENRIFNAIKNNVVLSEMLDDVKSKRFTHSRIRQIFMNAILGINRNDIEAGLSYIRVLGFNSKGRQCLHQMKSTSKIPVIANLSEIDKNNESAARDAYLDYEAGKLFSLLLPSANIKNPEYEIPPVCLL